MGRLARAQVRAVIGEPGRTAGYLQPPTEGPEQTTVKTYNNALSPDIIVRGQNFAGWDEEEGMQYGCDKAALMTFAPISQIIAANPDATTIDVHICESDDSLMTFLYFLHHGKLCEWTDDHYYTELTHYTDLFDVCMDQQLYGLAALVINAVDRPSYRTHCEHYLEADSIIGNLYGNREDPDTARNLTKQYRKTVLCTQALTFASEFCRADFEHYEKTHPGFLLDFTDGVRDHFFGKNGDGI